MRTSAEVLGKGTFGTLYKAALEDATTLMVKRLKEMLITIQGMRNLLCLINMNRGASLLCYMVYRNFFNFIIIPISLLTHLHIGNLLMIQISLIASKIGEGRTPVDWEARLRIAIGATKGIAHIHTQNGGKLVHGKIKASNGESLDGVKIQHDIYAFCVSGTPSNHVSPGPTWYVYYNVRTTSSKTDVVQHTTTVSWPTW